MGVTGSKRRPRAARIPPAADVDVGEPHISRQNLDQYLAATRRGQVILDDLQDLGSSELSDHHMPVFHDVISSDPGACDATSEGERVPNRRHRRILNRIRVPAGSAAAMTPGFPAELRLRRPSLSASGCWLPALQIEAIRDLATHHPATATPLGVALTASSLVITAHKVRGAAGRPASPPSRPANSGSSLAIAE